jgi:hypothetical protein
VGANVQTADGAVGADATGAWRLGVKIVGSVGAFAKPFHPSPVRTFYRQYLHHDPVRSLCLTAQWVRMAAIVQAFQWEKKLQQAIFFRRSLLISLEGLQAIYHLLKASFSSL